MHMFRQSILLAPSVIGLAPWVLWLVLTCIVLGAQPGWKHWLPLSPVVVFSVAGVRAGSARCGGGGSGGLVGIGAGRW